MMKSSAGIDGSQFSLNFPVPNFLKYNVNDLAPSYLVLCYFGAWRTQKNTTVSTLNSIPPPPKHYQGTIKIQTKPEVSM